MPINATNIIVPFNGGLAPSVARKENHEKEKIEHKTFIQDFKPKNCTIEQEQHYKQCTEIVVPKQIPPDNNTVIFVFSSLIIMCLILLFFIIQDKK